MLKAIHSEFVVDISCKPCRKMILTVNEVLEFPLKHTIEQAYYLEFVMQKKCAMKN